MRSRDGLAMAAITAVLCVVSIVTLERIGVNGGQGWDGMSYVQWAADFPGQVLHAGLTRYHSQRVLPSAAIWSGLKLARVTPTVPHIIRAFQGLDAVLLVAAAWLWARTAIRLELSRIAGWVGYVALFGAFANAKHALYYPTLTDVAAFALGMLAVWAFVAGRPIVLWLAGVAAAITWPALPPLVAVLLLFPRPSTTLADATIAPRIRKLAAAFVGVACGVAFAGVALHYLHHPVPGVGDDKFAAWVRRDLLVVTLPLLVGSIAVALYALLSSAALWNLRAYLGAVPRRRLIASVIAVVALFAVRALWVAQVGTHGEGPSTGQFFCEHTLSAIRGPLWGPVHSVVYWGPIVIVAALAWRRVAAVAVGWGPGAVIALALVVAFASGANSRQWNHLAPFLVAATIVATAEVWTVRRALGFAALALAWSKVWLTLGYDQPLGFWEFPNQRYFMNQGPYASDAMYLVHVAAVAVTAFVLFLIFQDNGRATPSSDPRRTAPAAAIERLAQRAAVGRGERAILVIGDRAEHDHGAAEAWSVVY
ncbi:MAG: hypothetical protein ABI678_09425 [Kofleriaceae bacterium]